MESQAFARTNRGHGLEVGSELPPGGDFEVILGLDSGIQCDTSMLLWNLLNYLKVPREGYIHQQLPFELKCTIVFMRSWPRRGHAALSYDLLLDES